MSDLIVTHISFVASATAHPSTARGEQRSPRDPSPLPPTGLDAPVRLTGEGDRAKVWVTNARLPAIHAEAQAVPTPQNNVIADRAFHAKIPMLDEARTCSER